MRSGADCFTLDILQRGIVEQAHYRIAVFNRGIEPVFIKPQVKRNCRKDFGSGCIELAIQFGEDRLETVGPLRPDVGRHRSIGQGAAFRQVTPDMPEFLHVVVLGILGNFNPERSVATRPGNGRMLIAALFFFRQGKEFL